MLEQLNAPFLHIPDHWTGDYIKPGHQIGKAKYLFTQIDPKKEDEWREMYGGTQAERLKKEEETAKKQAQKQAIKAKKAAAKAQTQPQAPPAQNSTSDQTVEETAIGGAKPTEVGKDPVDAVTDGMQQVTLPSS